MAALDRLTQLSAPRQALARVKACPFARFPRDCLQRQRAIVRKLEH